MLSGIFTVISLVCFFVVVVWALWPNNAARFKEAAMLPVMCDDRRPMAHKEILP